MLDLFVLLFLTDQGKVFIPCPKVELEDDIPSRTLGTKYTGFRSFRPGKNSPRQGWILTRVII
jgi:hypothetical protein